MTNELSTVIVGQLVRGEVDACNLISFFEGPPDKLAEEPSNVQKKVRKRSLLRRNPLLNNN
jgi:hypothetical protein